MIYAQIKKGIVANVLVLEDTSLAPMFAEGFDDLVEIKDDRKQPSIGWTYDERLEAFSPPPAATPAQAVGTAIASSIQFGNQLMLDFASENVLLGITQARKTGDLMSYMHQLSHSILSGSLYEAITLIDQMIQDTSPAKASLAQFLSKERLASYKNKIQAFLGVPLT
jgi:hypothetical protein